LLSKRNERESRPIAAHFVRAEASVTGGKQALVTQTEVAPDFGFSMFENRTAKSLDFPATNVDQCRGDWLRTYRVLLEGIIRALGRGDQCVHRADTE